MDFGISGRSGLKVYSQRPRNPLTIFGEIHSKAPFLARYIVKPKGGALV